MRAAPSLTRSTSSSMSSLPTATGSFSILSFSPAETRYCLPPVLTTAYMPISESLWKKTKLYIPLAGMVKEIMLC